MTTRRFMPCSQCDCGSGRCIHATLTSRQLREASTTRIGRDAQAASPKTPKLLLGVLFNEFDRVTEGLDFLGGVVWNVDVEFFFQFHDEFDNVERIRAEVVYKMRLVVELL